MTHEIQVAFDIVAGDTHLGQIEGVVTFTYRPGCPAQTYGDPSQCYPAEPPEVEFVGAKMLCSYDQPDGVYIDALDVPGPIYSAFRNWFDENYDLVCDHAEQNSGPDPDYARDCAIEDERMDSMFAPIEDEF